MILYLSPLFMVLVMMSTVEAPHVGVKISVEVDISEFSRVRGKLRIGCGVSTTSPCSALGLLDSFK